jgi:hypothetical protein
MFTMLESKTNTAVWNARIASSAYGDDKVFGAMVTNLRDPTLHTKAVMVTLNMASAEDFCSSLLKLVDLITVAIKELEEE